MTTMHMIELGHKKIGYIGGDKDICVFRERYEGYCSALEKAQIPLNTDYCFFGEYDKKAGYNAGIRIAEMIDRPTAVCAASDVIAIGVMHAFNERNIRVPEDIAVIGIDDIDFDTDLTPKLSSVKMQQQEIGKCAVGFLFSRINGDNSAPKKIIFQPQLVKRESSMPKR